MHFNTSHVSINQENNEAYQRTNIYFNTSHVSINLSQSAMQKLRKKFQYISCFY